MKHPSTATGDGILDVPHFDPSPGPTAARAGVSHHLRGRRGPLRLVLRSRRENAGAQQQQQPAHMPQLDGLRAVAVAAVLLQHFGSHRCGEIVAKTQLGVPLFFVLSGFLITGILLRCRSLVEDDGQGLLVTLRQFYARRSLRILPAYYLTLAVAAALGIGALGKTWPWHAAYLSNFYYSARGSFDGLGYTWSLAAEEQFYLLWPLAMLTVPRRWLLPMVLATACLGPAWRLWAARAGWNLTSNHTFPLSALDRLALGALLALACDRNFGFGAWRAALTRHAAWVGMIVVAVGYGIEWTGRAHGLPRALIPLGGALVFTWLVAAAARGFGGVLGKALSCRPVTYVGQISYGIYLYQGFTAALWHRGHVDLGSGALTGVVLVGATVLIAAAVYHAFERPVNELKKHFPYRMPARAARPPIRMEAAAEAPAVSRRAA